MHVHTHVNVHVFQVTASTVILPFPSLLLRRPHNQARLAPSSASPGQCARPAWLFHLGSKVLTQLLTHLTDSSLSLQTQAEVLPGSQDTEDIQTGPQKHPVQMPQGE